MRSASFRMFGKDEFQESLTFPLPLARLPCHIARRDSKRKWDLQSASFRMFGKDEFRESLTFPLRTTALPQRALGQRKEVGLAERVLPNVWEGRVPGVPDFSSPPRTTALPHRASRQQTEVGFAERILPNEEASVTLFQPGLFAGQVYALMLPTTRVNKLYSRSLPLWRVGQPQSFPQNRGQRNSGGGFRQSSSLECIALVRAGQDSPVRDFGGGFV